MPFMSNDLFHQLPVIFCPRLIGIGLEPLGLEEFVLGEFFSGELFVDKDKASFNKLGFKRFSILSILSAIVSRKAREAIAKARVSSGFDFEHVVAIERSFFCKCVQL
jgi:hypothetical protein